jgi:hypothetical protein
MQTIPLRGRPDDVGTNLSQVVSIIVDHPWVEGFHIGRTGDLHQMQQQSDFDRVFAVYASENESEAVAVDRRLGQAFAGHAKFSSGVAPDERDRLDPPTRYVYVGVRMNTVPWESGL